jgi:starch phosphorylase
MFIFGLTAGEVENRRANGYAPRADVEADPTLAEALEAVASGVFSPDDPGRFRPLIDDLLGHDHFMVVADFTRYAAAQRAVDDAFCDPNTWWRRAVLNTANVGWFSSDRTIRDYASEIWDATPALPPTEQSW